MSTAPLTPGQLWPSLLTRLLAGEDLSSADTSAVMEQILLGEASSAQLAAFAVALRAKGETATEVVGLASAMLAHAARVQVDVRTVDIVGTGGDRSNTVNISTMAAVITAAAGAPVVKHGNRASSSTCGSADLLEGLGVAFLPSEGVAETVRRIGIGFCFAPLYHPSFRHAAGPRREIGIPTVFNILGPLANPAQPLAAAVGCGFAPLAPVIAGVFAERGADALVFRGDDGLDELTTTTTSTVWQVHGGTVTRALLDPADLDIGRADLGDLVGGDLAVNVAAAREVFAGKPGAIRDAVLLNAAAGIAAHTGLTGDLLADLATGMERAAAATDSGAAAELLDRWVALSTQLDQ